MQSTEEYTQHSSNNDEGQTISGDQNELSQEEERKLSSGSEQSNSSLKGDAESFSEGKEKLSEDEIKKWQKFQSELSLVSQNLRNLLV